MEILSQLLKTLLSFSVATLVIAVEPAAYAQDAKALPRRELTMLEGTPDVVTVDNLESEAQEVKIEAEGKHFKIHRKAAPMLAAPLLIQSPFDPKQAK